MQRVIPHLWFDSQAEEAAEFYTSIFPRSRVGRVTRYGKAGFEVHGQPEGRVMTVEFELSGTKFIGLNGGPHFTFTPAISFYVTCESEQEVDALWKGLSAGGSVLMDLQKYEWSEKYGWVADRYGLTWQVALGRLSDVGPPIVPFLMFVGKQYGKAEEAMNQYTSLFTHRPGSDNAASPSGIVGILRHTSADAPEREGTVKHAQFTLDGEMMMAIESGLEHPFTFNEAVSLLVACENQKVIDHFWDGLTQGGNPSAQACGWLKDRFGVSWQVVPADWDAVFHAGDKAKTERAFQAMLKMKKLDIAALNRAADEA